ncbi:hypothetical protein D0869_04430 [Hortaea werneckii]|uniref:Uncharacterized protein n=1 Tax=Hortaea werneckii TaxID=91943 RepID=A0A3M6X206_HORWE|nr:hypothetical protein KC324_g14561 [Hortaea werneckii]KAI7548615.1 hypothetical protein KC316_g14495 [Hortaea werneckii]RMX84630.1 hypothetical protein D0869_04430 [Hortaea werneckii]
MSDSVDGTVGSPLPNPNAGATQGKSQRNPAPAQKRNKGNRRNQSQPLPSLDGTISDNVTNPVASPRSKKPSKPKQGVPNEAHNQNSNMGKGNGQKTRPVSVGGPMLPATPAKEQAYAGPTFQASPAPSSLPVPKFLSRSVPNAAAARQQSMQARLEAENTGGQKEESSPEPDVVAPVQREAMQSPLDVFFQADKAEKQKTQTNGGLLSPQSAARPPPATEPRNTFAQSSKSIFLRELNGDSGDSLSPKTMPPNQRPPFNERARSSPGTVPQSLEDGQGSDAYTQSLKDLLFKHANGSPTQSNTPPPQTQSNNPNLQSFHSPSPFNRPPSGPTTPVSTAGQQQQNHYALHYGNRNLSPLFKTARETPNRPSNLRQEMPTGHLPPQSTQEPPRQTPRSDANSFSRDFLNQHINSNYTAPFPPMPFMNDAPSGSAPASFSQPSKPPPQEAPPDGPVGASSSRSSGPQDFEDNLRRMMKLNVAG